MSASQSLFDYNKLHPSTPAANIRLALDSLHSYLGLEPFLTEAEIAKLDEKCMLVFLGEVR